MTAVLYDAPGPRARRRNLLLGVVGTALLAGVIGFVIYRFVATGQFDGRVWEWILFKNIQLLLLDGLLNTLRAFALAAVLSLVFGAVLAAGRLSDHAWVSRPATIVIEFFRAVPLLILIFILYFGVSRGLGVNVSAYTALVLGLMLYNGSVLAEVFRAGVASLPRGQREAAYALGFLILYPELLYQARFLGSQGQLGSPIQPVALVVAVIYITMCLLLAQLANYLERRTRQTRRGAPPPAAGTPELSAIGAAGAMGAGNA
jgi:glutamate transport system permease protein